jgi:hypothetical protein
MSREKIQPAILLLVLVVLVGLFATSGQGIKEAHTSVIDDVYKHTPTVTEDVYQKEGNKSHPFLNDALKEHKKSLDAKTKRPKKSPGMYELKIGESKYLLSFDMAELLGITNEELKAKIEKGMSITEIAYLTNSWSNEDVLSKILRLENFPNKDNKPSSLVYRFDEMINKKDINSNVPMLKNISERNVPINKE